MTPERPIAVPGDSNTEQVLSVPDPANEQSLAGSVSEWFKQRRLIATAAIIGTGFLLVSSCARDKNFGYEEEGARFGDRVVEAAHLQGEKVFSETVNTIERTHNEGLASNHSYLSVKRSEIYRLSGDPESRLHDLYANICAISIADCSEQDYELFSSDIKQYVQVKHVPRAYPLTNEYIRTHVPMKGLPARHVTIYYFDADSRFNSPIDIDGEMGEAARQLIQDGEGPLYGIRVTYEGGESESDNFVTTANRVNSKGQFNPAYADDRQYAYTLYAPVGGQAYDALSTDGRGDAKNEGLYLIPSGSNPDRLYIQEHQAIDSDGDQRTLNIDTGTPCAQEYYGCGMDDFVIEPGRVYELKDSGTEGVEQGFVVKLDNTFVEIFITPSDGGDARSSAVAIIQSLRATPPSQLHFLTLSD